MSRRNPSLEPSSRALFRYQAICQVLWLESRGEERAEAVQGRERRRPSSKVFLHRS